MSQHRPRIYLAGPEVFLPEARAVGAEKCRLAAEAGLEGAFPLDAQLDLATLPPAEQARRISQANEGLMRSCDALIANLTPFRGVSMDSGTAFEVGFMQALGRPLAGYTNVTPDYAERARAFRARGPATMDGDRRWLLRGSGGRAAGFRRDSSRGLADVLRRHLLCALRDHDARAGSE
jgi:nucleoside 2-deoxyribosyltransferase